MEKSQKLTVKINENVITIQEIWWNDFLME